jgi:purine nucleosidase
VKLLRTAVIALACCLLVVPGRAQGRLVIADQDSSTTADMALMLLLKSPEVQLLGITVVSGNTWRDEQVAHRYPGICRRGISPGEDGGGNAPL